jgi:hypothetical protein
MHLCYEILSLILFPLLPPFAIAKVVIIVFVHLMIIASPALPFCARLNPATPSPQSQQQIVSFWEGRGGHDIETPLSKATLHRILIVVCLSSVVSDETPAPPPQELPPRNKDTRGGCIMMPPLPRVTASPAPSPAPQCGSSFSSPLLCSYYAEPRQSATWPMIKTTRSMMEHTSNHPPHALVLYGTMGSMSTISCMMIDVFLFSISIQDSTTIKLSVLE